MRENGLFWTTAVPDDSVEIDLHSRTAEFEVEDLAIPDFGDVVNALTVGKIIADGEVSFELEWSGGDSPEKASDGKTFATRRLVDTATLDWSASEPGFSFESTATTKVNFAEIARERNGVFFTGGDDNGGDND